MGPPPSPGAGGKGEKCSGRATLCRAFRSFVPAGCPRTAPPLPGPPPPPPVLEKANDTTMGGLPPSGLEKNKGNGWHEDRGGLLDVRPCHGA